MTTVLRSLFARAEFRLCLVLWCFGYVLVDIGAAAQGRGPPGLMLLVNLPLLAIGVVQSLVLASLLNRLQERHALLQWPAIMLAVIATGAVQTLADFLWLRTLALGLLPSWQEWALSTDPSRVMTIYLLYTWTLALSVALIWSARSNDVARLNEARAAAFEAAASRAEAAALRLQLNPHFLFNTLNGIASLVVHRKTEQAEEMIGRLADFLRSSLAADPTALIPLRQELSTVQAYLHIEEARFGDRMRVEYKIESEALELAVPNFVLQPLIENAVKYGVAPSRYPILIAIRATVKGEFLVLSVSNNMLGERSLGRRAEGSIGSPPPGIGLENTRRRLQNIYGDKAWATTRSVGTTFYSEIAVPVASSTRMAAE